MAKSILVLIVWNLTLAAQPSGQRCDFDQALQLHRTGDLDGAVREYRACIAAEPGRVDARSNLGVVLAKLGRYQEAIQQYRGALNLAPALDIAVPLRFNLALAYYKANQIAEAQAEFVLLSTQQPGNLQISLLLGDCYLRTGEFERAIDLLTPLEAAYPDDSAIDYILGMSLIRTGKIPQGQVHIDRILRRGDSAEGHFLLGSASFMAHEYPAAVQEFSRAAAISSDLPLLQSYYGRALLFTGDASGAVAAFRKELTSDPNDYDSNFYLAAILARRGDSADAHALLVRAAQVRPASVEARDALANGFHFDAVADGIRVGEPAAAIAGLDLKSPTKPMVLVFGSYTCPQLRASVEDLKRLQTRYADAVDFRLIYIREAHANEQWQSTINQRDGIDANFAQPRDLAEKRTHADLCVRNLHLLFPAIVDGMDTAAEKAYQAWPSRVYLIGRDGRVAFNSRLGDLEFHPDRLDAAIRAARSSGATNVR